MPMRTCLSESKILFITLLFLVGCVQGTPQHSLVQEKYGFDDSYFTQGLTAFNNTTIIQSNGLYGESAIRLLDIESGHVHNEYMFSPTVFAEGNTYINNTIILITWKEQTAYYFNTSLDVQRTTPYKGEGWGLTHNNSHLIMSNGSSYVQLRSPQAFTLQKNIYVTENNTPVTNLNELAYRDGYVYANVWKTDDIVKINLSTGNVQDRYTFPQNELLTSEQQKHADVLNGVMNKNNTIYITGKKYPYIYKTNI